MFANFFDMNLNFNGNLPPDLKKVKKWFKYSLVTFINFEQIGVKRAKVTAWQFVQKFYLYW